MKPLPRESQIQAIGEKLGHGPGPYPTKLRAQLIKTIQLAEDMAADEAQTKTDVDLFVSKAIILRGKLREAFSPEGCESIVAALAPTIYRESKDRTPQK